jgi:hypothetical protein
MLISFQSYEPYAFSMKHMSCRQPGSARAEASLDPASRYAVCDEVVIGEPKPAAS